MELIENIWIWEVSDLELDENEVPLRQFEVTFAEGSKYINATSFPTTTKGSEFIHFSDRESLAVRKIAALFRAKQPSPRHKGSEGELLLSPNGISLVPSDGSPLSHVALSDIEVIRIQKAGYFLLFSAGLTLLSIVRTAERLDLALTLLILSAFKRGDLEDLYGEIEMNLLT